MTSNKASIINEYFSDHQEGWSEFVLSTYVIAQRDRIGRYGIDSRDGLPALWGHSYVRTYYDWANTPPPNRECMEGGIATSYYVVNSLTEFLRESSATWESTVVD